MEDASASTVVCVIECALAHSLTCSFLELPFTAHCDCHIRKPTTSQLTRAVAQHGRVQAPDAQVEYNALEPVVDMLTVSIHHSLEHEVYVQYTNEYVQKVRTRSGVC